MPNSGPDDIFRRDRGWYTFRSRATPRVRWIPDEIRIGNRRDRLIHRDNCHGINLKEEIRVAGSGIRTRETV